MRSAEAAITVVWNINLLMFRYVCLIMEIPGNRHLTEGLIFQMPWWDLKTALFKGRFWRFQ